MSVVKKLFRTEAVENATVRHYGAVLLARPLSFSVWAGAALVFSLAVVIFFCTFDYQRKVKVSGVLLPEAGLIRVVANQGGVIVERRVREGQAVAAGDPLFLVANERFSATRGDVGKGVSDLLQGRRESLVTDQKDLLAQSNQRAQAMERRADDLAQEVDRFDKQMRLQQSRLALTSESLKRYADMLRDNYVSEAQVQERQGELLDQQQRLAELARAKAATARELATLRDDLRNARIQIKRDQENASRTIAAVDQDLTENEARRETEVRARQEGVVTAISAEPGQTVAPGMALAYLLPADAKLQAELYVPSRAAGFLKPGMDVLMRYQAYPYQKFGQHMGHVLDISNSAMRPEELTLPGATIQPGNTGEPLYRLRVVLDEQDIAVYGKRQPLKSGTLLEASVLLEKRPLYQWVLEPLFTLTGRL